MNHQDVLAAGKNFKIFDRHARIFYIQAIDLGDEGWMIDNMRYEPDPASDMILAAIEADKQAGKADLIAYILISDFVAGILFLEGVLTVEHFARAESLDGCIVIADVQIGEGEQTYTIKIQPEYLIEQRFHDFNVATMTADDQVI
jgi:hypothetical protein